MAGAQDLSEEDASTVGTIAVQPTAGTLVFARRECPTVRKPAHRSGVNEKAIKTVRKLLTVDKSADNVEHGGPGCGVGALILTALFTPQSGRRITCLGSIFHRFYHTQGTPKWTVEFSVRHKFGCGWLIISMLHAASFSPKGSSSPLRAMKKSRRRFLGTHPSIRMFPPVQPCRKSVPGKTRSRASPRRQTRSSRKSTTSSMVIPTTLSTSPRTTDRPLSFSPVCHPRQCPPSSFRLPKPRFRTEVIDVFQCIK